MRSRVLAVLLLVVSPLALVAAAGEPASAERWTHRDPAKDVYQQESGTVPAVKQGDITAVAMSYQRRSFVLDVKVRALHREQWSYLDLFLDVPRAGGRTTSREIKYYFTIDEGDDLGVFDPTAGVSVDCSPVTGTHSYKKSTLRIVVPQDCLGRRATKVTAGTYFYNAWRDLHGSYVQTDDGLRKGVHDRSGVSPELSRG